MKADYFQVPIFTALIVQFSQKRLVNKSLWATCSIKGDMPGLSTLILFKDPLRMVL